ASNVDGDGLLTGYFEPIVAGSRFPSPEFHVPVYRRPRDLVAVGYNPASIAFPNKGVRIGRRTANNELVPYHDRGTIEAGALDGQKLEICWLKDPFDLLTIQIEGSARVILEDGTPLHISYDSHNGYRYSSIERVLVERNLISRQEMSAQRIREWMAAHPDEGAKVRAANRSYVFFRITGLWNEGEPVGAQGVPLTPGRSIAVDRVHEYGTPFFIEANLPIENVKSVSRFGRLMIAQDTRSALVGPAPTSTGAGAMTPAASPAAFAIPADSRCSFRASSTWSRPAGTCRCRCRNRRSPKPKSTKRTARAGRVWPPPARSRPARICPSLRHCRRQNRRCPRSGRPAAPARIAN